MKEKRLGSLWCEFQVLIKNDTKVFWFDVIGEGADVLTDFLRESGLNVCGVTWIIKLLQKKTHLLKICWSVRVEFFLCRFHFFFLFCKLVGFMFFINNNNNNNNDNNNHKHNHNSNNILHSMSCIWVLLKTLIMIDCAGRHSCARCFMFNTWTMFSPRRTSSSNSTLWKTAAKS